MSRRRDFTIQTDAEEQPGRVPQYVIAVERAFEVLRCFGVDDIDLTNTEIVARTGLSKSAVSRLCNTLTRLGYLTYAERTGTYALAAGLISLAGPLLTNLSIRERARPLMREMADEFGASMAIAAPAGIMMTYVEHVPGSGALVLRFSLGSQMPMERTAMGRAYLAGLDSDTLARTMGLLRDAGVTDQLVERGIADAADSVRKKGFCMSLGEWRREINAVATPLRFPGSASTLALNCGAPASLLHVERMRGVIGPRLVEVARALGAEPVGPGA